MWLFESGGTCTIKFSTFLSLNSLKDILNIDYLGESASIALSILGLNERTKNNISQYYSGYEAYWFFRYGKGSLSNKNETRKKFHLEHVVKI